MLESLPHSVLLFSTGAFVVVCSVLVLLMVRRHSRRRRRLSELLAHEGWEAATTESGWGFKPQELPHPGNPSRVSIKPKARLAELRLSVSGLSPEGLGWMLLDSSLLDVPDRDWIKGLPPQAQRLVQTGKPKSFLALPGYALLSQEGVEPPAEVVQLLGEIQEPRVNWVVWVSSSEASVRRFGHHPDGAWPVLKQVGQALTSSA